MNLSYLRGNKHQCLHVTYQVLRQLKERVECLVGLHHCNRIDLLLCLQMVQRLKAHVVLVVDNCGISLLCL